MSVKKDWLLEAFIKAYLDSHTPIGSESLRLLLQGEDMQISSATIRNYFKRLTSEGALRQSHTSGGRIPTTQALKDYWRAKLDTATLLEVDLNKIQEASVRYGIFSFIERYKQAILLGVYNFQERFLILDFGATQMLLGYSKKLESFLKDLVGLGCQAIQDAALLVCITSLAKQIKNFYQERFYFGLCALAQLLLAQTKHEKLFLEICEGSVFWHLKQGLHFERVLPLGFLGVVQSITTQGLKSKMFCVGSLERDFEGFYSAITRAS
ncbi:HrcA family transcriptional regulator [Helicobacter bizzozeronii]|uniref:HrcA family transcriptional regulator n=1 Tax=Helicobacter bizzozeronii TaxID=56877 RepID=UPI000CEE3265|nr:HrcA family transcriptional regulator [Helicobacter bizzozeronii]